MLPISIVVSEKINRRHNFWDTFHIIVNILQRVESTASNSLSCFLKLLVSRFSFSLQKTIKYNETLIQFKEKGYFYIEQIVQIQSFLSVSFSLQMFSLH